MKYLNLGGVMAGAICLLTAIWLSASVGCSTGSEIPPDSGRPASSGGMPSENSSSWEEFADAGGHFRCKIPGGCFRRQLESGARSKVVFRSGPAEIGVIVRQTNSPEVCAEQLPEITEQCRQKTRNRGVTLTILAQRVIRVDGHPAADIVARAVAIGQQTNVRWVKSVAGGRDHSLTLTAPASSFAEASQWFDRFLESYRLGAFGNDAGSPLDKKLPAEPDHNLEPH